MRNRSRREAPAAAGGHPGRQFWRSRLLLLVEPSALPILWWILNSEIVTSKQLGPDLQ
jgi:hypothetical protein